MGAAYESIPVGQVVPSPHQARKSFDEEALRGLAESMRHEGLVEPIVVRRVPRPQGLGLSNDENPGALALGPGAFELISGERRLRAARLLGWETIEAKIITTVSDAEAAVKGLIENIQREDLNPIEEAEGFQLLNRLDEKYWNLARIGQVAGRSESYVSRSLSLLTLPTPIIENLRRRKFSRGHGIELSRLPSEMYQLEVANQISDRLTVHETRELIDDLLSLKNNAKVKNSSHVEKLDLEDPLQDVWIDLFMKGVLGHGEVSYSEAGWSFLIKSTGKDPRTELSSWFQGIADGLKGKFKEIDPYPDFNLPRNKQEQADLEALAAQGPYAVYRRLFGEEDENTRRVLKERAGVIWM
jgi:ParB/RepB/Spo0J family partition protein